MQPKHVTHSHTIHSQPYKETLVGEAVERSGGEEIHGVIHGQIDAARVEEGHEGDECARRGLNLPKARSQRR